MSGRPSGVGAALVHESAELHVTGQALYTDDLGIRHAGTLHAWPVQSLYARARIVRLDPTPAYEVPGVVRVLSAQDVPGVNDAGVKHDEPLFPDEVQYWGHPVCWVLGETLDAARHGANLVRVEYEALGAVLTLQDAVEQQSFQGTALHLRRGDVQAAFMEAAHVFEGELEMGGQEHFYLETHVSLAYIDEGGQLFVQSSTQHPTETQEIVAHVLGIASHQVTVQSLRMGGAFGGKEMQPHGFAAVAALGATLTGRPVRLRLNRTQDMTITGKRHPFLARWKVGFHHDGTLCALAAELYSDGGWSLDLSEPVMARALCHIDNAYHIPHVDVMGRVCKTNKTSQTAFRGFGGPQGMLVIEDILGRVAPLLGLTPEELRARNFYQSGQSTPYGQGVKDAGRIGQIWADLLAHSDFHARRAEVAAFNAAQRHTKRGLAITPVKFGISFNFTAYNQAGALVHVYRDGSVLVNHGGTEMGQGLHTKMLQVAASALGVPLGCVRLAPTRTDKVPNTSATAASSGADLNGAAIKDACDQIKARLAAVAAGRFGSNLHPDDVRFEAGRVFPIGHAERGISFQELVHDAYHARTALWASGFYRTPGLHWDRERMQGEPFKYFSYGAAVTEVEVDGFTGAYRFPRVDILHDVGDSLSPLIDIGQIEGGFVQGLGWLTLEDLRWDVQGRLATRSASTYKLPSFSEMPDVFNVRLMKKATETGVIYGSKAVGEPPLMLAISAREALRDAVRAFGQANGVTLLASPATPEAVFWAIERARTPAPVAAD
ncbi:xanthine dehydrogenase molybdopterin binding subunit [Deinococcus peraridilitoris]|uniref:Xanthine dehydrogenase, molybdopterin binding subunit n=1 Tax=Deinococcus peraridilitoris (strain DSM 19664 / LMG 22246 / CIP 109416 / KR-200) TaxID=937777 RepID=K9ZWY2_DEIPD|nr:xanthine dehydrogenase molybdopterin binding subunit [Deinococcus peraridilitoris]AFZ65689.1 xanthine dehydrogenase, molybdopterin binding subunit [Deinococcus peraridilitoris DSM 19664]